MIESRQKFIPVLSSIAGACLTSANWQEVAIHNGTYYLESLLIKPGYPLLRTLPNINKYLAWPGPLIINASQISMNKNGKVTLVSPYDGSRFYFEFMELFAFLGQLKPQAVLLPPTIQGMNFSLWQEWPTGISLYVPVMDYQDYCSEKIDRTLGIYWDIQEPFSLPRLTEQLAPFQQVNHYFTGIKNIKILQQLVQKQLGFIESDAPAAMALEGMFITREEVLDIKIEDEAMDYRLLDRDCLCPVCLQQLTRAYLHHLLQHTPLLAQRYLIQHNVFRLQNY